GASGLERRGLRISRTDCFETFEVPSPPVNPVPAQTMTLKAGCNAIDAGAVLPNVNQDAFAGGGPDLGAYEYGQAPPVYGPRVAPTARLLASPSSLTAGQTATLSWTTTDATQVTIDPLPGDRTPSGTQAI